MDSEKNLRDILTLAMGHAEVNSTMGHTDAHSALVVYDTQSELSRALYAGYRRCLPSATFVDFDQSTPDAIHAGFETLHPSDLVVLIQSTNFRLEAFRIRVELFKRGLKVIEHPHLARMTGVEAGWYLDALAYDPAYYRGVGHALKTRIDRATSARIDSGGEILHFASSFEDAKLNVGDYTGMKNIGGQFPIGEVFTEARDLEAVQGRLRIFIFADTSFMVNQPERPITMVINKGRVTGVIDSTPDFDKVLANIRADENEVWVRELGFGLNRAFTPNQIVRDIGTLERMCGIHLSLGAKHAVYQKPAFRRKDTRHHVDVFAATEKVFLDDDIVYENGAWIFPELTK